MSMYRTTESDTVILCLSDVNKRMSLPLNGFCQDSVVEPQSHRPDQAVRGAVENWPDWSDPEEGEGGQPVHIHIQAHPASSTLSHHNTEEEPWEDFEDTEPVSGLSPTAQLCDPVLLTPPGAHGLAGSSKPLKLSSSLQQSKPSKTTVTWANALADEERDPHSMSKPKPTGGQKGGGVFGLGEEFTIKVKKKQLREDPEMDLFADMVPDIKLFSPSLLPGDDDGIVSDAGQTSWTDDAKTPQQDTDKDTGTLSAKFAAVNLSEVSGGLMCLGSSLNTS